jgi:hypothetical protein
MPARWFAWQARGLYRRSGIGRSWLAPLRPNPAPKVLIVEIILQKRFGKFPNNPDNSGKISLLMVILLDKYIFL